jgi:hypothetical protein
MTRPNIMLAFFSLCTVSASAAAISVDLGVADSFAVLGAETVTNIGPTILSGNLGVYAGTAIVDFPPGIVLAPYTTHTADGVAMQAQLDLKDAYNEAAGQACDSDLSGQDLGGLTLTPGVYCFSSSAQLTGALSLNALGNSASVFIFQIVSTLTTASASSVSFTNGGQGGGVYWQVGSSATLGTTTQFTGNILALESITLNTGAKIDCGRALARTGAVTLDNNTVSIDSPGCLSTNASPVPEPGTAGLLGGSVLIGVIFMVLRRARPATSLVH